MSNGARFVTSGGRRGGTPGYPVKAIWASHGRTAPPFDGAGQLTVPTVFSTAGNDFTVPPGGVIQSFGRPQRRHADGVLHLAERA